MLTQSVVPTGSDRSLLTSQCRATLGRKSLLLNKSKGTTFLSSWYREHGIHFSTSTSICRTLVSDSSSLFESLCSIQQLKYRPLHSIACTLHRVASRSSKSAFLKGVVVYLPRPPPQDMHTERAFTRAHGPLKGLAIVLLLASSKRPRDRPALPKASSLAKMMHGVIGTVKI